MTLESHAEAMSAPICCHGDCNQGRKCPTRQACEMPLDEDEPAIRIAAAIGWALLWIATIAFACGGAALAGMALLDWLEPHWPALVSMVTP